MKILFGLHEFTQSEAKDVNDSLEAAGIQIESYDMKYTKKGILAYLEEHTDIDVVIFSMNLENSDPYKVEDLERLVDKHESVRFIPILNDDSLGTELVKDIYNLGIMDATRTQDADIDVISKLVRVGRTRKEAKAYYKIKDVEEEAGHANIAKCVRYISSAKDEQLADNVFYIRDKVEEEEFAHIIDCLPNVTKERIHKCTRLKDIYEKYLQEEDESTEPKGLLSGFAAKIADKLPTSINDMIQDAMELIGKDDENVGEKDYTPELKDVLKKVLIGFVGSQKRIGTTHQAIMVAHYLAAHGYEVALLDCACCDGRVFKAIEKYRDVDRYGDYFSFQGVDYFKNVKVEDVNFVLAAEKNYHFVVIDYGVYTPRVKTDIGRCSMRFAVCGSKPWELGALQSFARDLKSVGSEFHYIVRGGEEQGAASREIVERLLSDYVYDETVDDPFSGECYDSLANYFNIYTNGEPPKKKEASSPSGKIISFRKTPKENKPSRLSSVDGRTKKSYIGTAVCFVTSLSHGCGNSHFAVAVANYMSLKGKRVCLISNNDSMEFQVYEEVGFESADGFYDKLYSEYEFLVFDCGVYTELSNEDMAELLRANYKVVMSWADDDYFTKLANLTRDIDEDEAERWIFAFNNVPDRMVQQVNATMNAYTSCCLPVYQNDRMPKTVTKILNGIFG